MTADDVRKAMNEANADVREASGEPEPIKEIVSDALKTFERRGENPDHGRVPLPWPSVESALEGGLWAGGMYILAGLTGAGKTMFALAAILHAARKNIPCVYVSLEMEEQQLVARLLALMTGMPWKRIYKGELDDAGWTRVQDAAADLHELPIAIDVGEPFRWKADRLETLVDHARSSEPSHLSNARALVVLDYLQLAAAPGDGREDIRERVADIRERVARTAYKAREVARDQNAALLLISSVSRSMYKAEAPPPKDSPSPTRALDFMGAGKESGEIEYAADGVMVLTRAKGGDLGDLWLAVPKVRMGPPAWVRLDFDGTRFEAQESLD